MLVTRSPHAILHVDFSSPEPVLAAEELMRAQKLLRRVPVGESVVEAILAIVRSGRPDVFLEFYNSATFYLSKIKRTGGGGGWPDCTGGWEFDGVSPCDPKYGYLTPHLLLAALERFELSGFEAADWEAFDAHAGQRLRVRLADGRTLSGIACGLAENGALRLRNRRGVRAVTSGRLVSARTA